MSEIIVHAAITDDIARLASACTDIHALTRRGLEGPLEMMTLGSSTRFADKHSVGLLERIRADGGSDPRRVEQLTFLLGWITHRAADRQMKPVFRANPDPEGKRPTLCSVYQDAFVFRKLMQPNGREPYWGDMWRIPLDGDTGSGGVERAASELQRIITMMLQRSLLEFHTLIPNDDDIEGWLAAIGDMVQVRRNDLHRYVDAILHPDPELEQRYIHDINFYDESDPIITAARDVQHRGATLSVARATALAGESHYAQAMAKGLSYVLAADGYFAGRLDPTALERALDIGKTGPGGMIV